ncbi:MAG: tyrosine recombinase [Candidatus Coatesbacteria bacterium]|nr:MAG: tyrosine recombinase [Candidatus Coatesbacteria bacterium]
MNGDAKPPPAEAESAAALRGFQAFLVAECGLAANTVEAYLRDVRDFLAYRGEYRGATLNDVVAYVRELSAGGAAAASLSRRLSSLRVFYRYLSEEGEVAASPLEFVPSPKTPARLPDYLHVREVEAIIAAAAAEAEATATAPAARQAEAARDAALLAVAYSCGLRATELVTLRRADVDLNVAVVRVRGKGGKERLVPFGEVARRYLERYLAVAAEAGLGEAPYLFPSRRREGPISRQLFWKVVKKYAARAGVPGVKPHLFRHTFATHLIQAGADVRTVQELLGHANVTTTQIYAHLDTKSLQDFHALYHPRK